MYRSEHDALQQVCATELLLAAWSWHSRGSFVVPAIVYGWLSYLTKAVR
jgi:hypothetical protein